MRITVFAVAMAILVTGLALLLVFGNGSAIAGLAPGDFANAIYLTIFALLVGSALIRGRQRTGTGSCGVTRSAENDILGNRGVNPSCVGRWR